MACADRRLLKVQVEQVLVYDGASRHQDSMDAARSPSGPRRKAEEGDLRALGLIPTREWPERLAIEVDANPAVVIRDYTGLAQSSGRSVEPKSLSSGSI